MRPAIHSPACTLSLGPALGLWMLWTVPTPLPFSTSSKPAQEEAVTARAVASRPRTSDTGRRLYHMRCARCHEDDGKSGDLHESNPHAPDFTNPDWQQRRSTQELIVSILDGKGTQMPAFGGKLSSAQARELVAHIRSFAPSSPTAAEAPQDDFETRFRELEEEFERLQQQLDELSPRRKR